MKKTRTPHNPLVADDTRVVSTIEPNRARVKASADKPRLHRQPLKGVYVSGWIVYSLVLAAFDTLSAPLGNKPRPDWPVMRTVRVNFLRRVTHLMAKCGFYLGGRNLDEEPLPKSLKWSVMTWAPSADESLVKGMIKDLADLVRVKPRKVPCFWFASEFARRPKKKNSIEAECYQAAADEKVVMHFHGGGYILGSAHESDSSVHICRGLVFEAGCERVLSVDYRLATAESFPAALLDALSSYACLVNKCKYQPRNITISGDSAGGHLALAIARYLRDSKVLPLPGGLLLLSPLCDTTFSYRSLPSGSFKRNYNTDIVDIQLSPYAASLLSLDLPTDILRSAYLSPVARLEAVDFGNGTEEDGSGNGKGRFDPDVESKGQLFEGFPRTLIISGEAERLLDEHVELNKRMKEGGVDVTLHEEFGAMHDFLMFPWMEPARTNVLKIIGEWVAKEPNPAQTD